MDITEASQSPLNPDDRKLLANLALHPKLVDCVMDLLYRPGSGQAYQFLECLPMQLRLVSDLPQVNLEQVLFHIFSDHVCSQVTHELRSNEREQSSQPMSVSSTFPPWYPSNEHCFDSEVHQESRPCALCMQCAVGKEATGMQTSMSYRYT